MDGRKMDKNRALSIMGFANARPIDAQMGKSDKIREVLDKALFDRTQQMMHGGTAKKTKKKAKAGGNKKGEGDNEVTVLTPKDSLVLHEAYQFLVKKYIPTQTRAPPKQGQITEKKHHRIHQRYENQ